MGWSIIGWQVVFFARMTFLKRIFAQRVVHESSAAAVARVGITFGFTRGLYTRPHLSRAIRWHLVRGGVCWSVYARLTRVYWKAKWISFKSDFLRVLRESIGNMKTKWRTEIIEPFYTFSIFIRSSLYAKNLYTESHVPVFCWMEKIVVLS